MMLTKQDREINRLILKKVRQKMAKEEVVKEEVRKPVIARSRYENDYVDPGIICTKEEGMTKQSFKDECDLNIILKKYESTGQLPSLMKENPIYGDFTDVPSYENALNIVSLAQDQFDALDARVRARFENDPAKFLAFVSDKSNIKELVQMGLAIEQPQPQTVSDAPVGSQAASTSSASEVSK